MAIALLFGSYGNGTSPISIDAVSTGWGGTLLMLKTPAAGPCSRLGKKLPKYAAQLLNLKAWLARLTHNLCVDLHRKSQRGAIGVEQIEAVATAAPALEAVVPTSPEAALLRHELGSTIQQAIDALPPRYREPFVLRYCEHLSYRDIAQRLALSEAYLYKRVRQAKAMLQQHLNPYLSDVETPEVPAVPSHPYSTSVERVSNSMDHIADQVNYRVTVLCLETLSHSWLPSPSLLG